MKMENKENREKLKDEKKGLEEIEYTLMYELKEQVEDLSKATGVAKHIIRRILKQQRVLAQNKMKLGYGYNLKGIVSVTPKERNGGIELVAKVAQSVSRPVVVKKIKAFENPEEKLYENMIEDEELI